MSSYPVFTFIPHAMGDAITHGDRLKYHAALLQVEVYVKNASIDIYAFIEKKRKVRQRRW